MRIAAQLKSVRQRLKLRKLRRAAAQSTMSLPPGAWQAYDGLTATSTTLVGVIPRASDRSINLVLPELNRGAVFAGVRTALAAASMLANENDANLRVISYGLPAPADELDEITSLIRGELAYRGRELEFVSGWSAAGLAVSPDDVWIATYWNTAHALDVACRSGAISADRVIYLIQDYEPGFFPGSTESAIAQSTYHAGFHPLVNSLPLREFLAQRESIDVPAQQTFRPELDIDRLSGVKTGQRSPGSAMVVGFYGRPSKPRNSFMLGVAALKVASVELTARGIPVRFVSIGEAHAPIRLSSRDTLEVLGRVPWDRYFETLGDIDVLLSLQLSHHPSHPPLDAVASGGWAITNEMDGTRGGLSPRLLAVLSDPYQLGMAVVQAVEMADRNVERQLDLAFVESLGRPLAVAVAAVARVL